MWSVIGELAEDLSDRSKSRWSVIGELAEDLSDRSKSNTSDRV